MNENSPPIYLVDGSGYIFRAFYAVQHLSTKAGFPTNALFGFTRMLKKLLNDAESEDVVVVFDAGRETFRNELYPEYKANRAECPSELSQQMPYFRDIARALGLPVLEQVGYEADDIIGTLARKFSAAGQSVVVVSGDKDLMQLIDEQVSIWDTMNDKRYGRAEVKEKWGVWPEQVVELLALMGDSSDNIPGIDGVGPKTAAQLIEKYESIDSLLNSLESLKNDSSIRNRKKISDQIELNPERLRLNKKLVTIETHVPVLLNFCGERVESDSLTTADIREALRRGQPQHALLRDLVTRFEFGSLLSEFENGQGNSSQNSMEETPRGATYKTILSDNFKTWSDAFLATTEFAFDLETTSLNTLEASVVGISVCWSDQEVFYIPVAHTAESRQISFQQFIEVCGDHFKNAAIKKCGQNLKYDMEVLATNGIEVDGIAFDSMVAAYILKPDQGSYNLTVLARQYLDLGTIEYEEVLGEADTFADVDIAAATRYACQDAHYTWLLKQELTPLLEESGLTRVYSQLEVPLIPVLARMELCGITLDTGMLERMSEQMSQALDGLKTKIYEVAGSEFNLNSPKQLAHILFEQLGIPTKGLKKTKTGISTDSSVLEKLAEVHPLPALILQYRNLFKLKSTYVDALPVQCSAKTGRLHSKFNQTITGTGRLSSSEPNLQNIPIQTAEGRKIRAAFVAADGCDLISADYSQIELRLLAHLSGDRELKAAFAAEVDIHARTARQLLGIAEQEEVSPEQRRVGKTINFGIIYGMSAFRLSRDLEIPLHAAQRYIDDYFKVFSGVRAYFDALERDALERGYVETLFGRKRFLSDIDATGRDKGFVLRAALNAPLQGSAADVMKAAMIKLDQRIVTEKLPAKIILQIHDELVLECPRDFTATALPLVQKEMEQALQLDVPLKVDIGYGRNWEEAHR